MYIWVTIEKDDFYNRSALQNIHAPVSQNLTMIHELFLEPACSAWSKVPCVKVSGSNSSIAIFPFVDPTQKVFRGRPDFILAGGDMAKFEIDEFDPETGTQGCLSRDGHGGCKKSPCFIVTF